MEDPVEGQKKGFVAWVKKLGWIAFFFFLLKGLAWIAVGYFGIDAIFNGCN